MSQHTPLILLCSILGGCSSSPSISLLGAFFPDWMFCIFGAMVMTGGIHVVFRSTAKLRVIGPRSFSLIYVALTVVLAQIGWLIFFKN
jgi:hypothetical protein